MKNEKKMKNKYKLWLFKGYLLAFFPYFGLSFYVCLITDLQLLFVPLLCLYASGLLVLMYVNRSVEFEVVPHKYHIISPSSQRFVESLICAVEEDAYRFDSQKELADDCKLLLFAKLKSSQVEFFALLQAQELTKEALSCAKKHINKRLRVYQENLCNDFSPFVQNKSYLIFCVCSDQLTKDFSDFVGQNVQQSLGKYWIPAGILVEDKTFYIAAQKGGLLSAHYNRLRRKLVRLAGKEISKV